MLPCTYVFLYYRSIIYIAINDYRISKKRFDNDNILTVLVKQSIKRAF